MACDYETKAMGKFLLPNQPDEGNFTSRAAYKAAMKVYQCDHMCVVEACEWWKQGEQIKDVCQEAEAARAKAVAKKDHREAEEWSRKHHCLEEEEEAEAGMSTEHCKQCIMKGKFACRASSPC